MKKRKVIFMITLGLAFFMSSILNNESLAGSFDSTSPAPGGSGEDCNSTEHTYYSYSTLDGPPQHIDCSNCVSTGETEDVYIDGQKVGILYKRALVAAPKTVTNCKFFNSSGASCVEISFFGSNSSCEDIFVPDTGTDSDTI